MKPHLPDWVTQELHKIDPLLSVVVDRRAQFLVIQRRDPRDGRSYAVHWVTEPPNDVAGGIPRPIDRRDIEELHRMDIWRLKGKTPEKVADAALAILDEKQARLDKEKQDRIDDMSREMGKDWAKAWAAHNGWRTKSPMGTLFCKRELPPEVRHVDRRKVKKT